MSVLPRQRPGNKVIHLRERPRQQRSWLSGIYYQCLSSSHPSTVPSNLNGGFGREKLNNDPSSPDRLNDDSLPKEGEGAN